MKIIENILKRRVLKSYVKVLPSLLKKRYGKHKRYTEGQVRKTVEFAGLNQKYLDYAFAMYISRDEYEALTKVRSLSCGYDEARLEVANDHFGGNSKFTIHDLFEAEKASPVRALEPVSRTEQDQSCIPQVA